MTEPAKEITTYVSFTIPVTYTVDDFEVELADTPGLTLETIVAQYIPEDFVEAAWEMFHDIAADTLIDLGFVKVNGDVVRSTP